MRIALMAALAAVVGIADQAAAQTPGTPGGVPSGMPPVFAVYPAKPEGPLDPADSTHKVDAIDFLLMPGDSVEYKFRLAQGATMIYTWKADGVVRFDFHTVPDGRPPSASEKFEAGEAMQGAGTYTAPYAGLHGWWFENRGTREVNIRVQAAGFFTQAMMFSGSPTGEPFEVQDPPVPPQ